MGLLRVMMPPKLQLLALLAFAVAMFVLENQIQKLEESRGKLGKFRTGCCCCCRSSSIGSHRRPLGQLNPCTSNAVCGQSVLRCATHMASITSQTIADTRCHKTWTRAVLLNFTWLQSRLQFQVNTAYQVEKEMLVFIAHVPVVVHSLLIHLVIYPQMEAIDQLLYQKSMDHTKAQV